MAKRPARHEVPEALTWNLNHLFTSDEAWAKEVDATLASLDSLKQFEGTVGSSQEALVAALEAVEAIEERTVLVATYASLRESGDSTDPVNQALTDKASAMVAAVRTATGFVQAEVLEMEDGVIEQYLADSTALDPFRATLQKWLSEKPYRLSTETERTLSALGQTFSAPYVIYNRGKLSDMQFNSAQDENGEDHPVSFALYEDVYEFTTDHTLRRNAYDAFAQSLDQYKSTFAATYGTEVRRQVTLAKLRGYKSTTEMLLHPQQVTEQMYHNQLDIISTQLAPHMRRLANLRKRLYGLDELRHCDLKIPLDPDFNPKTTIEDASGTILEALKVLGPEYGEFMQTALDERWIDYVDNIGKSTGAFCSSPYGAHSYILITWANTMRSAFVLAHELGHAGHFSMANKYQRIGNTRPSTYFVEAPSTTNEMLLADHILNNTTDPRMRRWVISQLLGTYYHNFVTHLLEGLLQRRVYELADQGTSITATLLSELKGDILRNFWGDAVTIDKAAELTWMRQPHYYMGLYPYTYSAGLTAATNVAQQIREQGAPAAERWIEVLKAGGTKTPLELMKMAGVDMSTPQPIIDAVNYVGKLVDELEASFAEELTTKA